MQSGNGQVPVCSHGSMHSGFVEPGGHAVQNGDAPYVPGGHSQSGYIPNSGGVHGQPMMSAPGSHCSHLGGTPVVPGGQVHNGGIPTLPAGHAQLG